MAIVAAVNQELPVFEYAARQVKQTVVGIGLSLIHILLIGMRVKSERSTCVVSNGKLSSETKTKWERCV